MLKKYSEKSRQTMRRTSIKWNKNINRVVVSFKPSDDEYYKKWLKVEGSTNLEKIKNLLG